MPLYSFTSHTFTNCGKTGYLGPSLSDCTSSYGGSNNWWNNTNYFNVIGQGIQVWKVPGTGTYKFYAQGAREGYTGRAEGARVEGIFSLTEGDTYMILVGQAGIMGTGYVGGQYYGWKAAGGGGGTFVVKGTNYSSTTLSDAIIVAGGGGGSTAAAGGFWGSDGENSSSNSTGGGTNSGSTGGYGGSGGSGLIGDGTVHTSSGMGAAGQSFKNGGIGSEAHSYTIAHGGFGGGGSGGGSPGGGGGGIFGGDWGYSGYGGNTPQQNQAGHGGGSYLKSTAITSNWYASNNNTHGSLEITAINPSSHVGTTDTTPPQLTTVSIVSNNSTSTLAYVGNIVTLSFTADEPLASSPTCVLKIGGSSISGSSSVTDVSSGAWAGISWTCTYTILASDNLGAVTFTIDATDQAATPNNLVQVTSVTDGTSVVVASDTTPPQLTTVSIVSNYSTSTLAITGSIITLSFTSDESLASSPTCVLKIGGFSTSGSPSVTDTSSGAGTSWSCTYTILVSDNLGAVTFTIDATDQATNNLVQVTSVTDGTSVSVTSLAGLTGEIGTSDIKVSDIREAYNFKNNIDDLGPDVPFSKLRGVEYSEITTTFITVNEGSVAYATPGTYTWTCPANITKVSVVCCGGGGGGMSYGCCGYSMMGGGGGGLGWKNNITVVPGNSYAYKVGAGGIDGNYSSGSTAGTNSYFISAATCEGKGGNPGRYNQNITGGGYVGDGGGNGGGSVKTSSYRGPGGGGGAGGYTASGGNGVCTRESYNGWNSTGGGGGGGSGPGTYYYTRRAGGGGGVGYQGAGANGAGTTYGYGTGGSGGTNGTYNGSGQGHGGNYGGGGGGSTSGSNTAGDGQEGFVRIMWGDPNNPRLFPSTRTAIADEGTYQLETIGVVNYSVPYTGLINLDQFKGMTMNDMTPSMTITSTISDGDSTGDSTLLFTFTSTEPITTGDFTSSDITVTPSGASISSLQTSGSQHSSGGYYVYTGTVTLDTSSEPLAHSVQVPAGCYTNSKTTIGCKNSSLASFNFTYSLGGILQDIMSLAITLNGIQSVQKNAGKIGEVTTEIHNAHDNFNVFAVVGYGDLAESLPGSAWNYNTGPSRPTWSSAVFRYNSGSGNILSTGDDIIDMTGGSYESLSAIDGKKWMAMALYDGTTNGFEGIIIWVFTNALVNNAGTVQSSTRIHSNVKTIFHPDPGSNQYSQIHPVVIGPSGTITHSSTSGTTGWNFSNNQQPGSNGYYATNRFAVDDGCWGFRINDQVDGNSPGAYLANGSSTMPSFGVINPNSSDSQSYVYWNYSSNPRYSSTNHVGFVFSGDFNT